MEEGKTYNGNHAVWLEQGVEVLQELEGEERDGLGASRKDVVDDIVKAGFGLVGGEARGVGNRILDNGRVVAGELEVLGGELVNDWVEFHHRGVDAVGHKSCRRGANSQSAAGCQQCSHKKAAFIRAAYITSAFASSSRIGFGVLTSLTASSMANTP